MQCVGTIVRPAKSNSSFVSTASGRVSSTFPSSPNFNIRNSSFEISPAIREWIPDDDAEQSFDLFDQRPASGKPVEIPREDGTILFLDPD